MGTSKDNLIDRIYELEEELKEAKKHTYIHETHSLHCCDGEMHFGYGEGDNEKWLVYNTDQLFKDLPFIINQVIKENKKMQQYYLNNIVTELKEIDYTILQEAVESITPKDIPKFEGTLEKLKDL